MQFSISREAFLRPLQLVAGSVAGGRPALPIMANILIQIKDGILSLTGTDLEVELITQIHLESPSEEGEITVPARKLLNICRGLSDPCEIKFQVKDDRVTVRSGRSRYLLSSLPASDFPNIESWKSLAEFNVAQKEFKKLIEFTQFAMASQDVRYYLNGMYFEASGDSLRSVATDGHRLASCAIKLSTPIEEQSLIVPRKGVVELVKLLDNEQENVTIQIGKNNLRAIIGNFIFTSKLVDGRFPDYRRVIPRNGDKELIASRESLKQAFTRAAILSNEKFRGVRLTLSKNLLQITANNPEREEAEEYIDIDYQASDLEIGFNVSYVLDVLNTLKSEKIKITFSSSAHSALIESIDADDDALYVLMPMRL
ncbi:DNA polymerase III subunit beta [Psychromonas sp. CNPT3]|uniref:DNA polymerase III subunit beta n=1 Tax=Psychromonas sp. CNPT3 TaxID=314282 RepID=UPI00006E7922|nr:DNA polymerase III subunit beta [Psychromonas sp. CNPT3]AGH79944.1 DNA polymerase III subunit beta [Psychromonas sp. CNPT3]